LQKTASTNGDAAPKTKAMAVPTTMKTPAKKTMATPVKTTLATQHLWKQQNNKPRLQTDA